MPAGEEVAIHPGPVESRLFRTLRPHRPGQPVQRDVSPPVPELPHHVEDGLRAKAREGDVDARRHPPDDRVLADEVDVEVQDVVAGEQVALPVEADLLSESQSPKC